MLFRGLRTAGLSEYDFEEIFKRMMGCSTFELTVSKSSVFYDLWVYANRAGFALIEVFGQARRA